MAFGRGSDPLAVARTENDVYALTRQRPRHGQADALAGPGDDGNFIGELKIHVSSYWQATNADRLFGHADQCPIFEIACKAINHVLKKSIDLPRTHVIESKCDYARILIAAECNNPAEIKIMRQDDSAFLNRLGNDALIAEPLQPFVTQMNGIMTGLAQVEGCRPPKTHVKQEPHAAPSDA